MTKIFPGFFMLVFLFSSSDFSNNEPDLCHELGEMMKNDQKYRKMPGLNEATFFIVLDSLKKANNISEKEYTSLSEKEQLQWNKKARAITDRFPKYSQKEKDSLWKLQREIDHRNTKRLIEIVEEYGWVTKRSLECDENFTSWVFFRHSPKEYFPEIRRLIEKEKKENRLSGSGYMMISNHLEGRPLPDFNYVD